MSDISIGIGVRDNASGVIPGISRAIEELAASSEKLQKATDWGAVGNQVSTLTKYREELEKISRVQKDMGRGGGGGGGGGGGFNPGSQNFWSGPGNAMGAVSHFGSGAGAVSGITSAGQAIKGLGGGSEGGGPGAGGIIGAVVVGLGLLLKGILAVADKYREQIPLLMEYNALFGRVGAGSAGLKASYDSVTAMSMKYGYGPETGYAVGGGLARGGGREGSMATVMAFMRGTGIDQGTGVGIESLSGRFGGGGLKELYGAFNQTGMNAGRFGEYGQGATQAFEAALSRGVIRGMTDKGGIADSMNFLATGGEAFRGAAGARLYGQLDSSIAGSTGLTSQKDALMYRAAASLSGGGFLDTQKQLDKGFSPAMFSAVKKQIQSFAGNSNLDQIMMMRNAFGVSYTTAEKLVGMSSAEDAYNLVKSEAPSYKDTTEMKLLTQEEKIASEIVKLGETMIIIKDALLRVEGWVLGLPKELKSVWDSIFHPGEANRDPKLMSELGTAEESVLSKYKDGSFKSLIVNDGARVMNNFIDTMPKGLRDRWIDEGGMTGLKAQLSMRNPERAFDPLLGALAYLDASIDKLAGVMKVDISTVNLHQAINIMDIGK